MILGNGCVKGVIPAAGLGTRLHPFTLAVPKELLPLHRKPLIQWAVEELVLSGIREIGVIIRPGKEAIQGHLEGLMRLSDAGRYRFKKELGEAKMNFVHQKRPLGLGNAIYEARSFIGDSPFVMVIPDQFLISECPATQQLMRAMEEDPKAVWRSVARVYKEDLRLYPGARMFNLTKREGRVWRVAGFDKGEGPAEIMTLLGFGRTLFPPAALQFFGDEYLNPATGEGRREARWHSISSVIRALS